MGARLVLVVALLIAAMASFAAARWLGVAGRNDNLSTVVVAKTTVPQGAKLKASDLETMRWPSNLLPAGAFADKNSVDGRVLRWPVQAGEPILASKLAPSEAVGGLSSSITPGKRAISVRVNDVVGVAGFALPGSFVDVVVSARDAAGISFSRIVLSRIKVLAAAQDTQADPTKPKVVNAVTLELAPDEAEKLDLARSVGSLSLVLRNELDDSTADSKGAYLSDLATPVVGEAAPRSDSVRAPRPPSTPRPAVAARAKSTLPAASDLGDLVHEYRGNDRSVVQFRDSSEGTRR